MSSTSLGHEPVVTYLMWHTVVPGAASQNDLAAAAPAEDDATVALDSEESCTLFGPVVAVAPVDTWVNPPHVTVTGGGAGVGVGVGVGVGAGAGVVTGGVVVGALVTGIPTRRVRA